MNWKRRLWRDLLFALLGGVAVSVLYWGLGYTEAHHGFSIGMLGPAWEFARHHNSNCGTPVCFRLEVLVVNVFIYAFWIFVALLGIDLVRRLMRTAQ
jgi:hypothetical protein